MGLVYQKETGQDSSFAIWKIEESATELLAQLQLKEHETNYLERLANGKRNMHWLSTRVLLRRMMETSAYIDCVVDQHGKPYLANFPHHISLSHSFNYSAVMLSPTKRVGIDIEQIKSKITRIAHKFMCPEELDFMVQYDLIRHLYICWCAKEAVYKLQGRKNVSFLDNIRILPFHSSGSGSLQAVLNTEEESQQFTVHYEEFADYMIGYVSDDVE